MLTVSSDKFPFALSKDVFVHTLRRGIHTAVEKGADAGVRYATNNHQHARRTGLLTSRASLKWRPVKRSQNGLTIDFMNIAPYARFVEFGTRPHEIWPKEGHGFVGPLQPGQSRRAKTDIGTHRVALRWYSGGKPVFARMVKHPGTAPMPFMEPAAHKGAGPAIVRHIETRVVPSIIRQLG